MPIPDSIVELVEQFEEHRREYDKGEYNEAKTRIDYVNPFFTALGWDIPNKEGLSEVLREVVYEDKIKTNTMTKAKAPDYSFRMGGKRKFFVETKRPSIILRVREDPAFQLCSYGWTVKLPVSILTNFKEFVVYDTLIPPDKKTSVTQARLQYYKYTDYAEKWDEIASAFRGMPYYPGHLMSLLRRQRILSNG